MYSERVREKMETVVLKRQMAVLKVQKWRLRLKLQEANPPTGPGFTSYSSEQRALRKAKHSIPKTPEKKHK